jgi:hypothetical protein
MALPPSDRVRRIRRRLYRPNRRQTSLTRPATDWGHNIGLDHPGHDDNRPAAEYAEKIHASVPPGGYTRAVNLVVYCLLRLERSRKRDGLPWPSRRR